MHHLFGFDLLRWTKLIGWRMTILCCTNRSKSLTPITDSWSPEHRYKIALKNYGVCCTSLCLTSINIPIYSASTTDQIKLKRIAGLNVGTRSRKSTVTPSRKVTRDCTNNWSRTFYGGLKKTWRNRCRQRWNKSFAWTWRHCRSSTTSGSWPRITPPSVRAIKARPAHLST